MTTSFAEGVGHWSRAPYAVEPGPVLLSDLDRTGTYDGHRALWGPQPTPGLADLDRLLVRWPVLGRGGAGFPFVDKLRLAAAARRSAVVVNAAEGEPASAKDAALLTHAPHRVLDGAALVAMALGSRTVDVVLPGERPEAAAAVMAAIRERAGTERVRWRTVIAGARFVAGQESAVLELLAGRPGRPVTGRGPASRPDRLGRASLVSNAETWAHLAALVVREVRYAAYGPPDEPGTTLLTVHDAWAPGRPRVIEVGHGTRLGEILRCDAEGRVPSVLVGGYHGQWLDIEEARILPVSRRRGTRTGVGAGVIVANAQCPVATTAGIVGYLAGESAGRCGPCRFGLPTLATALTALARGLEDGGRLVVLTELVTGRGACRHPDGTARLVRSMLAQFPNEVHAHSRGRCDW